MAGHPTLTLTREDYRANGAGYAMKALGHGSVLLANVSSRTLLGPSVDPSPRQSADGNREVPSDRKRIA